MRDMQKYWEMVDEVLNQQFECQMMWEGDIIQLRHNTATDEEWQEEKKTQPRFEVHFFSTTIWVPGEEQATLEDFAQIINLNADSGESILVEESPTAVAALLYTGW